MSPRAVPATSAAIDHEGRRICGGPFSPPLVLFFFSNLMFETMSVSRYNGDTPRGLEVFAMKKNAMNPHRLAVLAMMTAVVFAVNFPRIIIPLPTGETSFTLANIACVLSGMLLGPLGGLASGLGSALYDLTNPIFAPECWLTFLTKGAMGLAAGLVFRTPEQRETASYRRCLASSLVGCLTYYLLYFSKSLFYDNMLVGGLPFAAAALLLPLKIPASLFNAAAAIAAAPPLCLAIRAALRRAHLLLE